MTPILPLALGFGLSLFAGLTQAALAESPMTAAEFEAYATGKTLSFAQGTEAWGSEQYLPDRKVIWAFDREQCQYGTWFEDQGAICFVYDRDPSPQCWHFFQGANGLRAEFLDEPATAPLSEVRQSSEPLQCSGPDVGA